MVAVGFHFKPFPIALTICHEVVVVVVVMCDLRWGLPRLALLIRTVINRPLEHRIMSSISPPSPPLKRRVDSQDGGGGPKTKRASGRDKNEPEALLDCPPKVPNEGCTKRIYFSPIPPPPAPTARGGLGCV